VDQIGRIGELRLLKLLVESAMHRWMYTNMRVVGQGQFGTVMQSGVTVGNQGNLQVAIKHIPKQTNIQDRCVLVDVFNEITCLDTVRFEDYLCQIYDFGVEESCYWIVMKQLAVATLHKHDIVHYDLKCDNIMIEAAQKCWAEAVREKASYGNSVEELHAWLPVLGV
ncbi:unnamed protein product, partial [Symbiodinium pilosum]